MVHYEDVFIEYPTTDMFSRPHYNSTNTAAMFNATTSTTTPYESQTYHNVVSATDNVSCTASYYDQSYRPPYWQQSAMVKEETAVPAYHQAPWQAYQTREGVDIYKQQEFYTLQNSAHGHNLSQHSPAAMGTQYAPCAMMSSLSQQHAMEEEMVKERQNQGYNGWISTGGSTNCKLSLQLYFY